MATNYKVRGETITFVASAALVSGQLVLLDGLAVVSLNDTAIGETAVGHAEGVYNLPALVGTVADIGADAYVTALGKVTDDATDNTRIGRFWAAVGATDTTVLVKLNVA